MESGCTSSHPAQMLVKFPSHLRATAEYPLQHFTPSTGKQKALQNGIDVSRRHENSAEEVAHCKADISGRISPGDEASGVSSQGSKYFLNIEVCEDKEEKIKNQPKSNTANFSWYCGQVIKVMASNIPQGSAKVFACLLSSPSEQKCF